ncbi:hypothetical protein V1288_004636 [Bradyrhizobium sp. AZCC 2176]
MVYLLLYWVNFLSPNFVSVRAIPAAVETAGRDVLNARFLDSSNLSMAVSND